MGIIRGKNISNIAKNIKDYRLNHDMKQIEMAELLEMNYQNYSKMERGVYTPSLDKVLEICGILGITPNDLLLEGREFDEYKQEVFEALDDSIVDVAEQMKIVEDLRAKAMIAKQSGDERMERIELDSIIQIFAYRNEHYWEIADYLYYRRLEELLRKASEKTLKSMVLKQMEGKEKE